MTEAENERLERLITAIERVAEAIEHIEKPSPGWWKLMEEFRTAVSRIPTHIRTRPF